MTEPAPTPPPPGPDGQVRIENRGGCAWVTLDRPPLNLLVPGLIRAIRDAFEGLARNPGVRAAVLTGAGRATTAGMQVQVLRELDPASAKTLISGLHDTIRAVHDAPFPTVCMVNGACLGAGFELAMACDMRVASTDAVLGLPEVRVGVPSVIEAALLPALVGPGRAAEMLFTGDAIPAARALEWGLVNRVGAAGRARAGDHRARRVDHRVRADGDPAPEGADHPVAQHGPAHGHRVRHQRVRPVLRHRRRARGPVRLPREAASQIRLVSPAHQTNAERWDCRGPSR